MRWLSWRRTVGWSALAGAALILAASCVEPTAGPSCQGDGCALPLASLCQGDGDCASGVCAQGVCCDQACDGACVACNLLNSSGRCEALPTVASVTACAAEGPAGGLCGGDGSCAAGLFWGLAPGGPGTQRVSALGSRGARLVVAGYYGEALEDFGRPLTGQGAFVAELGASGELLWRQQIDGAFSPSSLALDGQGAIWLGGTFSGEVVVGGQAYVANVEDGLVLRLEPDGTPSFARVIGGAGSQRVEQLALTGTGELVVVGQYSGSLQVGADGLAEAAGTDAFVALLDVAGNNLWLRGFGSAGVDSANAVAVSGDGQAIVVGGEYRGPMALAGELLGHVASGDAWLARLSAQGEVVWARGYGGAGNDRLGALAIDGSGELTVSGSFTQAIDLGNGAMVSLGCEDVFVARMTLAGETRWSRRFGDLFGQLGESLAVDSDGAVYLAGLSLGGIDVGWGAAAGGGDGDIYLLALDPLGKPRWVRALGDALYQQPHGVALRGEQLVVVGELQGSLTLGETQLTSVQGVDGFILALSP